MKPKTKVEELRAQIEKRRGYILNPDLSMTEPLLEALLTNEARYGYQFCPCRLATGDYQKDLELICPCDYRDQDINEYGTCFCGLYVSREVILGNKNVQPIPERRGQNTSNNYLWRCTVCGYLCVRPSPPDVCPICGVTHDRFIEYNIPSKK